jgi:hypothetical protein
VIVHGDNRPPHYAKQWAPHVLGSLAGVPVRAYVSPAPTS